MSLQQSNQYVSRLECCIPKIMRGLRIMRKSLSGMGLSFSQELVLIALRQHGESKMTDLSVATGLNITSLTSIVDGMVSKKLIERKRSTQDRRAVISKLTASGIKQANKLHKNRRKGIQYVIDMLPPAEKDTIIKSFEKIVMIIDQHNK